MADKHENSSDEPRPSESMTIGEHLDELRKRIIYAILGLVAAMAISLLFTKETIDILNHPYLVAMKQAGMEAKLTVLSASAGLTIYLRVALYSGLILGSPWILYQLWMFVAAGLYPRERRYVTYSVPFSAALFIGGAVFFLEFIAAPALLFFVNFNNWLGVTPIVTLQDHIDFMTGLMLIFGLVFQTPLVVFVLAKTGLVRMEHFHHFRKHVIAGITVFAGIFAPADLFSMFAMGLSMWMLYEVGVLAAYIFVIRKKSLSE
jgi:sec-independent protein translocase protein TatC